MGKKSRYQKKKFEKRKGPKKSTGEYGDIVQKNEKFEHYYKTQGILAEDEFDKFVDSLKVVLPTSFRITGSRSHAEELRDLMIKEYFPSMEDFEVDGEKVEVPKPLPWYPDQLAWVSTISRHALRKSAELAKFHRFLVAETEVGNISRQEVVSMIPVELLDVKPNHSVLDMCAAPGSKTAQILEAVHADESEAIPDGLVIANDADQARSYMLVKQAKRLQSPCLMVTNHDAQQFPAIYFTPKDLPEAKTLRFDRVLADVPCSGDGTFRKNKNIWKTWTVGNGNALHRVQLPILLRGCALVKVGGRIVYSTCSFNPMENEAVVAAAISQCGGAFRLVDVSKELPGLIRRPGMTSWKVQHKDGTFYESYENIPEASRHQMVQTLFPPANAAEMNLERCVRVYPHDQNTGGFFVAVLEKVAPYGALDKLEGKGAPISEAEAAATNDATTVADVKDNSIARKRVSEGDSEREAKRIHFEENESKEDGHSKATSSDEAVEPQKKKAAWKGSESPFVFLNRDDPELLAIREYYGLSDKFPKDNFVVRSENDSWKTVYFVSTAVRNIVTAGNSYRLNIVNSGIVTFTRNSAHDGGAGSPFRLSNDGLSTIAPFVSDKCVIQASLADIKVLLPMSYPKFTKFSDEMREIFEKLRKWLQAARF
ncbi:cytosine(34)-C(5)-methyltransferase [Fimicolochytrium jonesii]|uniref:cytosine(34)-C(5)-methyltransferase n=1 Tax=Fimicolochytrium jonesii TaxID=1396493 RepID=UPI0022FDF51C|nr:cytosine(34)-C(5)-methyltransferase [Fimicolochytrium jonesii]KAI8817926.1 cytosine(34)-C(5)-methyltransferase [Fimicolochytrium jonesii]